VKFVEKDIFEGEYDYLIHCCNLYHKFGAGIAKKIKKRYPQAFEADRKTQYGDGRKLGTLSHAHVKDGDFLIVNIYAQTGIGNDGNALNRNLSYDALYNALYKLCFSIYFQESATIGVPDMIGCGLAGGERSIVLAILESLEKRFENVEFHIYRKK
jgi:O-acetyl-ADP-ribose deacetylase (regulator of RNase III)